ncbi:MAG: 4Fe-4S binding protein [Bacteroidales bacterium]|jgi:MinD superfamily P-loop ATPase|nr:4Fe-4S binding protein [Bacteroidales bacterium]NLM92902.1 4Fe-4S binding protein [Bacteroidales bacterium]
MEIAIISGKGGTGKSSISAAFATISEEVVLADCDVDAANLYILFNPEHEEEESFVGGEKAVIDRDLCTNCGLCIPYCNFEAIVFSPEGVVISETACDGCHLCKRVCPHQAIRMVEIDKSRLYAGAFRNGRMVYGRLAPGEENSGKLVNLVREKAQKQSKAFGLKTIIIDGPPGIGCPVISSITGVDQVVIITEPSLSGLHDLERAADVSGSFGIKTRVIINKADLDEAMGDKIETWCKERGLEVVAKIPFDPEVVKSMVNCKSISEWAPDSKTSQILRETWKVLLNGKG